MDGDSPKLFEKGKGASEAPSKADQEAPFLAINWNTLDADEVVCREQLMVAVWANKNDAVTIAQREHYPEDDTMITVDPAHAVSLIGAICEAVTQIDLKHLDGLQAKLKSMGLIDAAKIFDKD